MEYIKDFFYVQTMALKRTLFSLGYLPLLFVANLAILLLLNIGDNIFGQILPPLALQLVNYILKIFALSILFGLLRLSIKKNEIRFHSRGIYADYMGSLVEIALINYFIKMLLGRFFAVFSWYYLIIFILLNPLPESVYLGNGNGVQAIGNSLELMKNNFHQWLPNMVIAYFLYPKILRLIQNPLKKSPQDILVFLGINLVFLGVMIYRGQLYEILSKSNMRKRRFMKEME
ncbi:MAG: hypothetical protein Q4P28_01680 [Tissierellia bacterium]|nr:hypothetical protein [Tissierellia bacterium]